MNKLRNQWCEGPVDVVPLMPEHGRPVFCMAMSQQRITTGSADHGLRQYNISNGKYIRELFAKKYGHKEWVTTVQYLSDGRVVSGGMDSMICVWNKSGQVCDHFAGHQGSISKVQTNQNGICISSSYDCSAIVWDFNKKKDVQKLYGTHKDAIMDFQWHNSLLVSGDKKGVLCIWDINAAKAVKAIKNHKGAISNVKFMNGKDTNLILTSGLNDGYLVAYDMRTNALAYNSMVHTGAINSLKPMQNGILTGSADSTVSYIDQSTFKQIYKMKVGQMVFCVENVFDLCVCSTDNGNMFVYDLNNGQNLYGFGLMKKGVCRCLKISNDLTRVGGAGQDDNGMLLLYS